MERLDVLYETCPSMATSLPKQADKRKEVVEVLIYIHINYALLLWTQKPSSMNIAPR